LHGGAEGYVLSSSHARPDGDWDPEAATGEIRWHSFAPPQFAASRNGHKTVVWREGSETHSRMLARRYDPDAGWGGTEVVAGELRPPYLGCAHVVAYHAAVAMAAGGNAVAVWEDMTDDAHGEMGVWASEYVAGLGWQAPLRLDDGAAFASRPQVILGEHGAGVALWSEPRAGEGAALKVRRFTRGN
jgi:hypothetical protein